MLDTSLTKLSIQALNGMSMDIHIPTKINVLVEESGTGKSYLVSMLKAYRLDKRLIKSSNIDIDDILVWDEYTGTDLNTTEKLIFIDSFGVLQTEELNQFIKKSNNKFMLITQSGAKGLNISGYQAYVLEYNKLTHEFKTSRYFESQYGCGISREKLEKALGMRG